MERQSQLPQHNGIVELAGVRYQQQPDGTWQPLPRTERLIVEAPRRVAYSADEPADMGETTYQIKDIERLRSVVAAADVAREEINRKAAIAAEQLRQKEAALAEHRARAGRNQQLKEFYGWDPDQDERYELQTVQPRQDSLSERASWHNDPYSYAEAIDERAIETEKPKKRRLRRGIAIAALSGVVLTGVGGAVVATGYPMKWFAGTEHASAADASQVPLSAAKEQLIDAFGGCFDEQGNGSPLVVAAVQTTTDVSYEITKADNTKVVLAAADKSTGRTSIKPVVKLTDAKADYTACVAAADRGDVVKVDGNKIEVNESLISPQGHVAIASYLRGMMLNEADDSSALDTTSLITQLVNAKTISATEGKRVTDAYAADPTAKEEVRLAGALSAKELANDGDIYAQQAKARLDAAIKQALSAKVKQLHDQGAISIDTANIVVTGSLSRPIAIKNNDPTPVQNMPFTETGVPRVLKYTFNDGGAN